MMGRKNIGWEVKRLEGRKKVGRAGKGWREGKSLEGRKKAGGKEKSWKEGKRLEGRKKAVGKEKGKIFDNLEG